MGTVRDIKIQFSGRSVHKTDTFRVSTSIQPRLDVLWLITWSGSLQMAWFAGQVERGTFIMEDHHEHADGHVSSLQS